MKFFTLRIWFLALYIALFVACAQATTLTFVDNDGKETALSAGANKVPSTKGNIRADGVPSNTQSVLFKVNGIRERVENAPEYWCKGDKDGKPVMFDWGTRTYTVSAACYPKDGANGGAIPNAGVSVQFSLTLSVEPPDPDPNPDPDPPPTPIRSVLTDFALQPGAQSQDNPSPPTGSRLITEEELRLPRVNGLTSRSRNHWDYVAFHRADIERCRRTGDVVTLLHMGGLSSTPWDATNMAKYEQAAARMGAAFNGESLIVGVHITGCSPPGVSEELHWKPGDNRAYIAANKKLIDVWGKAFPRSNIALLHAIGGGDPVGMREIIAYGQARYPSRYLVKHNSMKAGTTLTAAHNQLVAEAGRKGSMIGFEAVGGTNESRFGGTLQQAFSNVYEIERQAGKARGQSYRAWYKPDLRTLGSIK
jgi:hypothetical protein